MMRTPEFQKQADDLWTETERMEFVCWIATNPLAGDVIPGAKGARKVRWGRAGSGKRGGVRVIYSIRSSPMIFSFVVSKIFARRPKGVGKKQGLWLLFGARLRAYM